MIRLRQFILVVTLGGCVLTASAQDPSTADLDRKRLDALRQENRYLQQRIDELENELDEQDKPDPNLQRSLEKAIDETLVLRDQVTRQNAEIAALDTLGNELSKAQTHIRDLETQLELGQLRQQKQSDTLTSLQSVLAELRKVQKELATRDRQIRHLQLALKGAEQETRSITQLQEGQRINEAQIKLLREERDAALAKIREAADELRRMRGEAEEAATLRKEVDTARSVAETNVLNQATRILELENLIAEASQQSARSLSELAEERDELILAANAIRSERDALVQQVGLLQEFEAELDESNQARIIAERRAAGAEANVLRGANELDRATAQVASLTAQLRTLEQECEALRNAPKSAIEPLLVGPPAPPMGENPDVE